MLELVYGYYTWWYVSLSSIRLIEIDKLASLAERIIALSNISSIAPVSTLNPSNVYVSISALAFLFACAFSSDDAKYIERNQVVKEVRKQDLKNDWEKYLN